VRPAPPDLSFAIIAAVVTVACAALAWLYRRVTHHEHGVTVH